MSLTASLNTALTGLQVNQNLMRIASANIANAGTEDYTKKRAELGTIMVDGQGAGVRIEDVRRVVDQYLVRQINGQTSKVATAETLSEFYTRLQDLFGTPADNSSISGLLNTFRTALEKLATDPQQSVSQFTAVTAANDVINTLNSISETLQAFRQEVDKQIGDGVDDVNDRLQEIDTLNNQIVRQLVSQQPVGDLLDKRDIALKQIAEQMDIKWFERPNGAVYVMTGDNEVLLDNDPRPLLFSSPSGVSKATSYPGSGFQPIEIENVAPDITTAIRSGKLKALIDLRDDILTGLQDQLDQLATTFADEMNRVHNSAMPIPGLTQFTGSTTFAVTDQLDPLNPESIPLTAYTDTTTSTTSYGVIQFAIIDSTGQGIGDALRVDLDEFVAQMEAYVSAAIGGPFTYQLTVGDIINMINGAYAATPPPSIPVPPAPAGWPVGPTWPPSPALVMPSTTSDIAGLYNLSGASIAGGFTNGAFARMVNGHLEIGLPTGSAYGLAIDDTQTTLAQTSDSRPATFNYLMGLNDLFVIPDTSISAARDIAVRSDIAADPAKIGRGYLTSVVRITGDPTTEEWYVGRGDGAGANAMADVFDAQYVLGGVGSLPQTNQRMSEYAASIIQFNARGAADAANAMEFEGKLRTELENRFGQISGVSVDEELASLVAIQNAYAASARVVTTVNSMYDDLLNLL